MDQSPDILSAVGSSFAHAAATVADLGSKPVVCASHGEYTATGARYFGKREVWSVCPDCKEADQAAERMVQAQAAAAKQLARLSSLVDQAAIPARFIGRSFDNFRATTKEQAHALAVAQAYADNFAAHLKAGTGLTLAGQPGTGKSHLAAAILQAIMPQQCGLYLTCMGMIQTVRNSWRKDAERGESEVLRGLATVPLLVLDEVGVQYGTDGEQTIIFDVLDRRYRDLKPTILLTNQDKAGLEVFIGERSFDRLRETARWVSFEWDSYRPIARREAA